VAPREQFHAEFEERGYHFKSYVHPDGPHFVIRVYKEATGELIREDYLPTMQFEPRWGVDVLDLQILEERRSRFSRNWPASI